MADQPQKTYSPQEESLIDTLNRAGDRLDAPSKQKIWDAYHVGTDKDSWVSGVNKTDLDPSVKQDLYNFRFKGIDLDGKPIKGFQAPSAPSAASPAPGAIGVSPQATTNKTDVLGQATGLSRSEPTLWDRLKQTIDPLTQHLHMGGNAPDPRLIAPEKALTPLEQEQHPMATGIGEFAGGLTSGENIAIAAGTGGFGELGPVAGQALTRLMHGGFSYQMLHGAYQNYKGFRDAIDRGDESEAKHQFTLMTLGAGFGIHSGTEATKGVTKIGNTSQSAPAPQVDQASRADADSTQIGSQPDKRATVPTQAPPEATFEQTTSVQQTKAPASFVGKGNVMRPWDPDGTRFSRGGTIGFKGVDLQAEGMEPTSRSLAPQDVVKDVIAPEPSQATQGANYRPSYTYKPSEKAVTMSAKDIDRGPEFNAQEFQEEINRNNDIIRNPKATDEDRQIAQSRLRDAHDGMARVQAGGPVVPDIAAPKPADVGPNSGGADAPKYDVSTDSMGVRWASDGTDKVSLPRAIQTPEDIQKYVPDQLAAQREGKARMAQTIAGGPQLVEKPAMAAPKRTGFDYPDAVYGRIDRLVKGAKDIDNALTDTQREKLEADQSQTHAELTAISNAHASDLKPSEQMGLRDKLRDDAAKLDAQGNAIRDLTDAHIKNEKVVGKARTESGLQGTGLAGMRMEGRKFDAVTDENGAEIGKVYTEDKVVKRSARSLMDEAQGRVPTSQFDKIKFSGKPEGWEAKDWDEENNRPRGVSGQEWKETLDKVQADRFKLKQDITEMIKDAASRSVDLDESSPELKSKLNELYQLEKMFNGKFEETGKAGRKKNVPASLDANGAIEAPEAIKRWNLDRVRKVFANNNVGADKYVRQMPTMEDMYQFADSHNEKALHLKELARQLDERIEFNKTKQKTGSQAGFVGEGKVVGSVNRSTLTPEDLRPADVGKRATRAGLKAWPVSDDRPSGYGGFLSPDGKVFIDKGNIDHDDVAQALFPEHRNPLWGMLNAGWIRKVTPTAYEAWRLDSQAVKGIETDLIRGSGLGTKWGEDTLIDTKNPVRPGIKSIHIDRGWSDLEKAIRDAKRDPSQGWNSQAGKVGGIQPLAGSTVGAVAGAVVGGVVGGPAGAMLGAGIGWGAGFLAPAILRSPVVVSSMGRVMPMIHSWGIDAKDWLVGKPQRPLANDPDMTDIINSQQRDVGAAKLPFLKRMAQVPGDIYSKWGDSMFFLKDQAGTVGHYLTKFSGDDRGQPFRDNRGKLTIDESPYAFAAMAAGRFAGTRDLDILAYRKIVGDANDAGLQNHLTKYLNLKGYQRVWDVVNEKMQDAQMKKQNAETWLQSTNLGIHERVGYENERDAQAKTIDDIQDRMKNGDLTPKDYDQQKIQQGFQGLQADLSPAEHQHVVDLANRVFKMNRKVLDATFHAGIIDAQEYQTYTSRGDEYVPMHRILDKISTNEAQWSGKASPLYLRQQNIIKSLTGSDKINRDPIVASADANTEAMREIMRNDTIGQFLQLAGKDPNGVGKLFSPLKAGTRVAPDETIVGHYSNGKVTQYSVPSWMGEALKSSSPVAADVMGKTMLRWSQQMLRETATAGNLMWSIPNAAKHFADMALMSKAGIDFTKPGTVPKQGLQLMNSWRKAVVSTLTKDARWQEMIREGAAYGVLQRNINPESQLSLETLGFAQKTAKARVVDGMAAVNRTIEDITKLTSYSRLREAGYTEHAAAYETRKFGGGPDFAQMGTEAPTANLAFMFFNAHLRYVGRVFERAAEEPGRIGAALAAVTMMGMTLMAHNASQKDEKGNYLLRKVPYNVRENNFVFLTDHATYLTHGGGDMPYYYTVPKGSLIKFLYNPVENSIGKMTGIEDRTGTQLGLDAINSLVPGQGQLDEKHLGKSAALSVAASLNPALKAPIEQLANKNFSQGGKPIVPTSLQKVDPSLQSFPNTPEIYKRAGQGGLEGASAGATIGGTVGGYAFGGGGALLGAGVGAVLGSSGISPLRIEHLTNSFAAGIGRTSASLADKFLKPTEQPFPYQGQEAQRQGIEGVIKGRFIGGPTDQTEINARGEFADNLDKYTTLKNSFQMLLKQNPQAAEKFLEANKQELWKATMAPEMQKRIQSLDGMTKQIQEQQGMSDNDRLQSLKAIHDSKMTMLKTFNDMFKSTPGSEVSGSGEGKGNGR